MMTGGRSAGILYEQLAKNSVFTSLSGLVIYWGDERCVPSDHVESNGNLVMRTLFSSGVPQGFILHQIDGGAINIEAEAERYNNLLPDSLDIVLLSIGDDGHIASIFPGSPALNEVKRRIVRTCSPAHPFERITITPPVLENANSIFILATSSAKLRVYKNAMKEPSDISSMPARMVLNAVWIFDVNSLKTLERD